MTTLDSCAILFYIKYIKKIYKYMPDITLKQVTNSFSKTVLTFIDSILRVLVTFEHELRQGDNCCTQ